MNILINGEERRPRAGWRLLLQFLIMFFFSGFAILGFTSLFETSLIMARAFPQCIAIVGSIYVAARFLDKRPFTAYGLHVDRRWGKEFAFGTLIAGIAMMCIFVIEWQMEWVEISGYGWEVSSQVSFVNGLISSFLAMLMVGFAEELFSRGYQILNITEGLRYPVLGAPGAVGIAVLATSVLFGLLHFYNPNASFISTFNIILAGIVLAVPYVLTGSLALSTGLHFSWNFVQGAVLGFPVSGSTFAVSIIHIRQGGTDLWTGGAFGPEAGLAGILGMAIMMGLTLVYIRKTGYTFSISERFKGEGN